MIPWSFIKEKLDQSTPVTLLYVLYSKGSSPGRQGFKMAVAKDGSMVGSIGGGIMEHKLVELVRNKFERGDTSAVFKQQFHHKDHPTNQSGMICSGEQTVVIFPMNGQQQLVDQMVEKEDGVLVLSPDKIDFLPQDCQQQQFDYEYQTDRNWLYKEQLQFKPILHLIGAGHVGMALSKVMDFLGFEVRLYDDRPDLNTMLANDFADQKIVLNYGKIGAAIDANPNAYVVIMSFGYRGDKVVLKQLLDKDFRYLGMMGSKAKVDTLMKELLEEGFDVRLLEKVKSPIGLPIHSKTPEEIAVSIAAEIIEVKNEGID